MAEPDTDVIQLKPPEESQCLTASPATCTITIKGYYRHSSILHMPKSRLAPLPFTSALPFSVITFLPSTHHLPALPFSQPVHHCPCDIIWFLSITLSLSFTLFRCYTVSFPFWRHRLICVSAGITLSVSFMSRWCNWWCRHFLQMTPSHCVFSPCSICHCLLVLFHFMCSFAQVCMSCMFPGGFYR